MDLILWRHAEAEDERLGLDDLQRALTPRGLKNAAKMGAWLQSHVPEGTRILTSPALRCEQTALALAQNFERDDRLAPDRSPADLLAAAQWPDAPRPTLLVGHQPTLGQAIAQLLGIDCGTCSVRKAGLWWLRTRERDGRRQTVVWAVQTPEML